MPGPLHVVLEQLSAPIAPHPAPHRSDLAEDHRSHRD
jgi:hypothetical protein